MPAENRDATKGTGPRSSLARTIRLHAATRPHEPAFTFVDYSVDRRGVARSMDYRELDLRAVAVAEELRRVCAPGDRVALVLPQGPDFLTAFVGCLYTQLTSVPLYAPEPFRTNERLEAILCDSLPRCVLTTQEHLGAVKEVVGQAVPECQILCVDALAPDPGATPVPDPAEEDHDPRSLAYLQYTSGSSSEPRGVLISHANLAAAAWQSSAQSELVADDVIVSWLPYFHDMGLIFGIAMPLSAGAHAVHMAPMAFVQQPVRWLRLISDYRGTWSATPNFALDLCVRRVSEEQRRTLRLDSLKALCNGSEQVRVASARAFESAFAPCGFGEADHVPGYGMAEATLGITTSPSGANVLTCHRQELTEGQVRVVPEDAEGGWPVVSCGVPMPEVQVRIVDPETGTELPPDRVGEIWTSGPNVAQGYWQRPQESAATFRARLRRPEGEEADGEWLRTGDLGFRYDGELYVTGRIKDVVIIDGRNHYPADVESTVESATAGLAPPALAAFGVSDGHGERLVVAVELRQRTLAAAGVAAGDVVRRVRREVGERHGVEPQDVLLLRGGTLPKTSSGKVRRRACAESYRDGAFSALRTDG